VPAGRPPKLSQELIEELSQRVERGEPLGAAVRAARASPRSLRRWRRAGQEALGELGMEARLVLALDRADEAKPQDWRALVARLEEDGPWGLGWGDG
jgi:hypothetical protein